MGTSSNTKLIHSSGQKISVQDTISGSDNVIRFQIFGHTEQNNSVGTEGLSLHISDSIMGAPLQTIEFPDIILRSTPDNIYDELQWLQGKEKWIHIQRVGNDTENEFYVLESPVETYLDGIPAPKTFDNGTFFSSVSTVIPYMSADIRVKNAPTLKIYSKDGSLIIKEVIITDDCERHKSLQGENYVLVKYNSDIREIFEVGSYIMYENEKFSLLDNYKPKFEDGTYVYELHFSGIEEKLAITSFFRHVVVPNEDTDDEDDSKIIREPEFNINAKLKTIGDIIIDSLKNDIPGIDWELSDLVSENTENKPLSFSAMKFTEALDYIATEFETEWWIEGGNILHLDKCEYGDYVELSRGLGGGIKSLNYQNETSIPQYIYAYGSERNIVHKTNSENIPYYTRLQLPGDKPYVVVPGINNGIEEIKFFEDIYPRRVGKISSVRVDDRGPYYFFKDDSINFNIDKEKGVSLGVHFESGALNGRDFEVNYDSFSKEFEIINSQENDVQLPFGLLIPEVNNEYVLYGLVMPNEYIEQAQAELKTKADKYADKLSKSIPSMQCTSNPVYFTRKGINLNVGNKIRIIDEDFPKGFTESRVTEFSYNLTSKKDITFTVGESISTGIIAQIQDQINDQASAIDGVYQNSAAISRNGWQTADELANMIDALRADLVLIGNTDGQFTTTCSFQANYKNDNNLVYVSSGQLQHAIYTDNPAKGRWNIRYIEKDLPQNIPYYIYIKSSKSSNAAEIEFSEGKQEHTESFYYFLVGTVSSIIDRKRALYIVNGYTLIAGGNITTGKLQDASGNMVIDLDTGTIKGPVTFTSGTSGLENIPEWNNAVQAIDKAQDDINGLQIGGRNYLLKPSGSNGWEISEEWKLEGYKMSFYGSAYKPIRSNIIPVKKGDVFTFSGDVLSSDSIGSFAIQMTYFDTSTQTYVLIYYIELRETGRHTFTFEIDSDVYDKIRLNIFSRDSSGDYSISLDNLKLEKGNRATDWSPAPEDMKPAGQNLLFNTSDFKNTDYWQLIQDEANINARLSIEQGCLVVDNFSNPQSWIYLWNTSFSDWKAGGEYVFSCELEVENINNWVNIEVTDGLASETKTLFIKSYFIESSPVRITDTFVVPENYVKDETSIPHFRIRIDDAKNESSDNPLCKIKIKNVIVSEGNTYTGYSKNPTEIDNRIADLDYLKDTFKKNSTTEIAGGVTLSRFIGVKAEDNTTVTGGMSGNAQNGLPLLFAGGDIQITDFIERAQKAVFNVNNDGTGKWGIFQVLNNKVIIYDEQGDRASVVISNRKVSEESNKDSSIKEVTLFEKNIIQDTIEYHTINPGSLTVGNEYEASANLTSPLKLEAGSWDLYVRYNISYAVQKYISSAGSVNESDIIGNISLKINTVLVIEDSVNSSEREITTLYEYNIKTANITGFHDDSYGDSGLMSNPIHYDFDTDKNVYIRADISGQYSTKNNSVYPVNAKYTWGANYEKLGETIISAVKTVNQNIIGSDGISIVYDADEFFEVTKKDNGLIKILATLHTPADVNTLEKGQLYCDLNGFVKVKQ